MIQCRLPRGLSAALPLLLSLTSCGSDGGPGGVSNEAGTASTHLPLGEAGTFGGDTGTFAGGDGSGGGIASSVDGAPVNTGGAGAAQGGNGGVPAGSDGGVVTPGASGCAHLTVQQGKTVDSRLSDFFTWSGTDCQQRTAALVRNDGTDGGYLRVLTYNHAGKVRTCRGTGTNGWNGAGYVVSHYASSAANTQGLAGKYKTILAGAHHAIHEFKWRFVPGGNVDVTVHWFFSTGRSHPVYSITYDATPAGGADKVKADARSPYSDMNFEDASDGIAEGIGWGDKYKLRSTGTGPVKSGTAYDYAFDYTQKNSVPHTIMWNTTHDAEMGYVQTQPFTSKIGGGDYAGGGTDLTQFWGKTGSKMPVSWAWSFQLNQYELPYGSGSHRLAWGADYGAVGQSTYTAFGRTESGYPFQSYAVSMVFGEHSTHSVDTMVAEIEDLQSVKLTASRGAVSTKGPGGVARTDQVTYVPAGFNHVYGVWDVVAEGNAVTLSLDTGGKSLVNPIFLVHNFTGASPPAHVTIASRELTADKDYFATVDTTTQQLWITFGNTLTGVTAIALP